MGAVTSRPMAAEEFWRLPGDGKGRSLVRGEVVEEMPPGGLHGTVASKIVVRLHTWAEKGPHGHVGVESGFILCRKPDVARSPDVFYVGPDRAPGADIPEAYWDLASDLAVEVVSASEKAEDVREKIRDYLAAGTPLVWVVHPRTREVVVHTPDGLARTYEGESVLGGVREPARFSLRRAGSLPLMGLFIAWNGFEELMFISLMLISLAGVMFSLATLYALRDGPGRARTIACALNVVLVPVTIPLAATAVLSGVR